LSVETGSEDWNVYCGGPFGLPALNSNVASGRHGDDPPVHAAVDPPVRIDRVADGEHECLQAGRRRAVGEQLVDLGRVLEARVGEDCAVAEDSDEIGPGRIRRAWDHIVIGEGAGQIGCHRLGVNHAVRTRDLDDHVAAEAVARPRHVHGRTGRIARLIGADRLEARLKAGCPAQRGSVLCERALEHEREHHEECRYESRDTSFVGRV
jgi:hypothetical protein